MRLRVLLLVFSALAVPFVQAETAMDITAEPHHRLLLENEQVRVFAFTLPLGERAYVKQEHNALMVSLNDCHMVMWSEGQSEVETFLIKQGDLRFSFVGPPHGFRNDENQECRAIIVEFLDPAVSTFGYDTVSGTWDYAIKGVTTPVDSKTKFLGGFPLSGGNVAFAQLLPGDSFPPPDKNIAELLVPVTDVDLKTKGDSHIRKASGEAQWMGTGRQSDLNNKGDGPARFVMVQLQAPASK